MEDLYITTELLNSKYLHNTSSSLEEDLIHSEKYMICENCIDSILDQRTHEIYDCKCHYILISNWECNICTLIKEKKKEIKKEINNILFILMEQEQEEINENLITHTKNLNNLSKLYSLRKHYNRFILSCLENQKSHH